MHVYVCVFVCIFVLIYICIHVCIYVYMYEHESNDEHEPDLVFIVVIWYRFDQVVDKILLTDAL